ncbi:MAG: hypothetical protein AB7T63_05345 [Planctomycetota bacterium]
MGPTVVDHGAWWSTVVLMPTDEKGIRQLVTFPPRRAKRVRALARSRRSPRSSPG